MKSYIIFFAMGLYLFSFAGCTNFSRDKDIALPDNAPKTMVLQADLPSDSPDNEFCFLTRTNRIGQYIKFDFNVGAILYRDTLNPANNIINGVTDRDLSYAYDTVTGAKMSLFRNDSFIGDIKRDITEPSGIYKTDDNLKPLTEGATYTIKVTAPSFKTIEAAQKVPNYIPAKNVYITKDSYIKAGGQKLSELFIEFDDPPNSEDYYAVSIVVQDTFGNFYARSRANDDVFAIDPLASSAFTINDRGFNGQKYTWRIGISGVGIKLYNNNLRGLYVNFRAVSKEFEQYRRATELIQKLQENPYVEPYTVFTNVKNGYGLFNISGKATRVYLTLK